MRSVQATESNKTSAQHQTSHNKTDIIFVTKLIFKRYVQIQILICSHWYSFPTCNSVWPKKWSNVVTQSNQHLRLRCNLFVLCSLTCHRTSRCCTSYSNTAHKTCSLDFNTRLRSGKGEVYTSSVRSWLVNGSETWPMLVQH